MKSNTKLKIIILITLGILFALAPKITINPSLITGNNNVINLDNENLKISAVSGKIHIIGDSGWVDFRSAGKCTGNGTYSKPYVIEDLIIDGEGSRSCILIENSDVFFKIENCYLYNSGGYYNAGIRLSYVTNSQLINNNCSSNYNGIFLDWSDNNTISGNTANYNDNFGIYLYYTDNNIVSGNAMNGGGICLVGSDSNDISGNNISYNDNWDGIYLEESNYNTISGNTIYVIVVCECNYGTISGNIVNNDGIWLGNSNNFTVSGNIMNGCGLGISINNIHNIDTSNLVNGKPLYYYANEINLGPNNFTNAGQVILVNCNDSDISNLNVSHASRGVSLYYCNNNTISGNTANYNNEEGILLEHSNNNNISGNTVNYNEDGIHLIECDDNVISGNTANSNGRYGIGLYIECMDCVPTNVFHLMSEYNTISGNIINNNFIGIYLYVSDNNTISGNTANNNTIGIQLSSSNNITVSGNIMNKCGLYMDGSFASSHLVDTTNLVNGKPLYYYINEINLGPNNFTNAGQVILINCHDSVISNLNVSHASRGVSLYYSNNNDISGNTANYNNGEGILLEYSNNNNISGNNVNYNENGILLEYSNNNSISGNTANNNRYGIALYGSDNNIIWGNRLIGNQRCIIEWDCEGNVIRDNDCTLMPSLNYFPIILIIGITIVGVSVFIIFQNRKRFRKPQQDVDFL
jgi:parallel beta-helix repeat protein